MKTVHCVFPNPDGQAYFARRLDCTHYQEQFAASVKAIKTCTTNIMIQIYYPTKDYLNDYLVILNESVSVERYVRGVGWRAAVSSILDEAEGWNKPSRASRQVRHFHDYGFTSSICTSRQGSLNGVSRPILKPNTLLLWLVCQALLLPGYCLLIVAMHSDT
jgi:hypothetical protein